MSDFAVAVNVANLYDAPNRSSDVVTQAVWNERVFVLDESDEFVHVRTPDLYSGWIRRMHVSEIWSQSPTHRVQSLFASVFLDSSQTELVTKLPIGAIVTCEVCGGFYTIALPNKNKGYVKREDIIRRRPVKQVNGFGLLAVHHARKFIGTPYLWGGCTPFGIDCSGFVQLAYKLSGIQLLRDADIQFTDRRFERVEMEKSLSEADFEAGDLVTFSRKRDGIVTHIGLTLGDGRFIHASGKRGVAIDSCESEEYGETYVGAIRLSADANLAIEAA